LWGVNDGLPSLVSAVAADGTAAIPQYAHCGYRDSPKIQLNEIWRVSGRASTDQAPHCQVHGNCTGNSRQSAKNAVVGILGLSISYRANGTSVRTFGWIKHPKPGNEATPGITQSDIDKRILVCIAVLTQATRLEYVLEQQMSKSAERWRPFARASSDFASTAATLCGRWRSKWAINCAFELPMLVIDATECGSGYRSRFSAGHWR
jgi:hypothetical protein